MIGPLNKILSGCVAVSMIAAGVLYLLWSGEVKSHALTKKTLDTAQAAIKQYEENKKISERTNNAYQADLNRLRADVKRLRSRPARCVAIDGSTGIYHEPGSGREYAGKNGQGSGISSEWLYDYAEEAERHRIDKNACIDFVNALYEGQVK